MSESESQTVAELQARVAELEAQNRELLISRQLFDRTEAMTGTADMHGRFTHVNDNWGKSLGWSNEELLTTPYLEFVHPEDRPKTIAEASRLAEAVSETITFTNRYRTKDGEWRWLNWQAISDGESAIHFVTNDITSIMREREALKEREQLLLQTGAMGRIGGWELDIGASAPRWSDEVYRIHEVPIGKQPGLEEAINFYAPEARPIITQAVGQGIADGTSWDLELPFITAKGRRLWVRAIGNCEHVDGQPIRLFGTFQDITERKLMQLDLERYSEALCELQAIGADTQADFEQRLQRLLALATRVLDMDFALIGEIADQRYTLRWGHSTSRELPAIGSDIDLSMTYCQRVYESRSVIAEHDVDNSELSQVPGHADFAFRSYAGAPIKVDQEAFGTLCLGRDFSRGPFTDRELDLLRLFAQWIGREVAQQQAHAQLAAARDAAEAASRAKSTFLATMSHEIRTPMNGIMGMAQVLLNAELPQEHRDLVNIIRQSGEALESVINQILDLSKIEAGKMSLRREHFRPQDVIAAVTQLMRPQAEAKGLRLGKQVDWPKDRYALGDEFRFRQIILNLVGNAIKFTDAGSVDIEVQTEDLGPEQQRLHVSVTDTGIGITVEDHQHLFTPFIQVNEQQTSRPAGTGLGLTIARELVELMQGSITCTSVAGRGSTFSFSIPLATISSGTPVSLETQTDRYRRFQAKVLVAEDNPTNQLVTERLLEAMGCSVTVVEDGAKAVQAVNAEHFDIIYMDCEMPILDGIQATSRIRAQEAQRDRRVPIIALTANAFDSDRSACLNAGMDDFLAKPIRRRDLIRTLDSWKNDSY